MDEEEEINASSFMMSDNSDDESLDLDDDIGSFKFEEEPDEDPEDRFH